MRRPFFLALAASSSVAAVSAGASDAAATAAAPAAAAAAAVIDRIPMDFPDGSNAELLVRRGDDPRILVSAFCARHGITYEAYSPLGGLSHVDVLGDADVLTIAAAHGVSAAQVALRWILQTNATFSANPGSSVEQQYFKEDLALFDFELSAPEMAKLNAK